jgi:hypothetical protein
MKQSSIGDIEEKISLGGILQVKYVGTTTQGIPRPSGR